MANPRPGAIFPGLVAFGVDRGERAEFRLPPQAASWLVPGSSPGGGSRAARQLRWTITNYGDTLLNPQSKPRPTPTGKAKERRMGRCRQIWGLSNVSPYRVSHAQRGGGARPLDGAAGETSVSRRAVAWWRGTPWSMDGHDAGINRPILGAPPTRDPAGVHFSLDINRSTCYVFPIIGINKPVLVALRAEEEKGHEEGKRSRSGPWRTTWA
jgi:hypothetical protein